MNEVRGKDFAGTGASASAILRELASHYKVDYVSDVE